MSRPRFIAKNLHGIFGRKMGRKKRMMMAITTSKEKQKK
jgi:hypothetical protein